MMMIEFWRSLCLILIAIPIITEATTWDYGDGANGPANWYKNYPECSGSLQSPIDYKTSDITYGQSLGAITLEGYDHARKNDTAAALFNTGHALEIVSYGRHSYNISGSGLPGSKFTLTKFAFHWGSSNSDGSEHRVNGKAYPAEIHFVHYNTKYNNLSEALPKKDGLAVLGVFLQVDANDNVAFKPIFDRIANVMVKGKATIIRHFNLRNLMPTNIDDFYRNNGSLTTPDCDESVTWTVFRKVVTISEKQLNLLRSLEKDSSQPIGKNFRPIQATNGRKIYATFPTPPATTVPPTTKHVGGTQALGAALPTIIFCALVSLALKTVLNEF